MSTFETSATVQEQGQIVIPSVPFAPGTQVDVVIRQIDSEVATADQHHARVERLVAALSKGRNVEPLGAFNRAELYDRDVLR